VLSRSPTVDEAETQRKQHLRDPSGVFKVRHIVAFLSFLSFVVNYAMRININIAIVEMVNPHVARQQRAHSTLSISSSSHPAHQQENVIGSAKSHGWGNFSNVTTIEPSFSDVRVSNTASPSRHVDDECGRPPEVLLGANATSHQLRYVSLDLYGLPTKTIDTRPPDANFPQHFREKA
jgi:hypothetical protein